MKSSTPKSAVVRLIIKRFAQLAIPDGGGLSDGVKAIRELADKKSSKMEEASVWVRVAIKAVREAGEPNPYKTMTDEEIAEVLIQKIESIEQQRLCQKKER